MSVLGRADWGEGGWARSGGGVQFERAYCRAGGSGWTLNDRGVSVWLGQRHDETLRQSLQQCGCFCCFICLLKCHLDTLIFTSDNDY